MLYLFAVLSDLMIPTGQPSLSDASCDVWCPTGPSGVLTHALELGTASVRADKVLLLTQIELSMQMWLVASTKAVDSRAFSRQWSEGTFVSAEEDAACIQAFAWLGFKAVFLNWWVATPKWIASW